MNPESSPRRDPSASRDLSVSRDLIRGRDAFLLATLAIAALATLVGALGLRMSDAELGLQLAVNGPRLLLAVAVGTGLAVSAGVRGAAPRDEPLVMAASFGAAFGGMRALEANGLGPVPDFVLGAALGAVAFVAMIAAVRRAPVGRWAQGLVMLLMLGAAVVAAIAAKGNTDGFRPFVWWLLGDLSRADWWGACLAAVCVAALAAPLLLRARPGGSTDTLAWLLLGVSIGAGGVIAWFGVLVTSATRRVLGRPLDRAGLVICGALGAVAMLWADALPRLLIGGFAAPIGVGVAVVAIPWFIGFTGERRRADAIVAAAVGLLLAVVVTVLTLVLATIA